eukprot:TRINITY_DN47841_c0_g1_i1.p1 TRINITY_DN47841_c0_g1~~TRINITY_DN47841_c0_g1_i1.p1  ORF type:complete len:547 (-),score=93.57 TRINITY_DN47841_c0_g1_i1:3592-5232(-)
MFRRIRARSRARRAKHPSTSRSPDAPPAAHQLLLHPQQPQQHPPAIELPRRSRTPSDSTPLITRSPSLPHSVSQSEVHAVRARTDIGTANDTSARVYPETIHRPAPMHPPDSLSVPDHNRRLSLDGELPPNAIRPDDPNNDMEEETLREGLIDFIPDAFTKPIDVSACSKAGWEPLRDSAMPVAPMHTVEVRKENQDAFCALAPFVIVPTAPNDTKGQRQIFLGVFDGHGAEGRPIAHYARDFIVATAREAAPSLAYAASHKQYPVPAQLHRDRLNVLRVAFSRAERALTESEPPIDHVFSGTTAVVSWLFGRDVYTAWTGDSRCVIGRVWSAEHGRVRFKAIDLSHDQKPTRADEKRRVRAAGGRIARWHRNSGPLRVWLPRDWTPGLAMTRSIGDTVLSEYGVSPVPEVSYTTLGAHDSFIVLASDGVWEFMTSQEVVEFIGRMRREGRSANDAAEALVREAVRRWRRNEVVVDDTTAVVVWLALDDDGEDDKKASESPLSRHRKMFSMARAKVGKHHSHGVHIVCDDGHLAEFHCKNDLMQGM